ncbi:MAG: hypothetical protein WD018_02930 [Nitrosopumilaceae archaeon]
MSQSLEILRELADMIVNASWEERNLTAVEYEYFDVMFEKALKLSNS